MKQRYRIAYLDQTGEMGGAEHLLLMLMSGIQDSVTPILVTAEDGPFVAETDKKGIATTVISLPPLYSTSWIFARRRILNPLAIAWNLISLGLASRRLAQFLEQQSVDLVQTNSVFAHLYGGIAARKLRLPCLWYFQDLVDTTRMGGLVVMFWRIVARALRARVVCVSRAVCQALMLGDRGVVIYTGKRRHVRVKSQPNVRSMLGLPQDCLLVGYVGRIGYVKGVDLLLEAAEEVAKKNARIHFVICGSSLFGEDGYMMELVRQVNNTPNLEGRWHWLGYVQNVEDLLSQLDMIVLPSRREALPLILLEAGLASRPVVATKVGGVPEIVVHGRTGILVEREQPREIAAAILGLADDTTLRKTLGEQAKSRVENQFDLERYLRMFLELYESVIDEPVNTVRAQPSL